jgi:hypothetical protein
VRCKAPSAGVRGGGDVRSDHGQDQAHAASADRADVGIDGSATVRGGPDRVVSAGCHRTGAGDSDDDGVCRAGPSATSTSATACAKGRAADRQTRSDDGRGGHTGWITGGELRGTVLNPEQRGPAYLGKFGFDRTVKPKLRVRMTGSLYTTSKSASNTLYGGDRAGSRYYWVMENTQATESGNQTSGLINPGFRNKITAMQFNPFVKFHGLEVFGVVERAEGRAAAELTDRTWNQYATDVVYRFFPQEQVYAGVRYNKAQGTLAGIANTVGADRWQLGGGWFVTPNVLMKGEYVNQQYNGYPATNIRNGGTFHGLMLEGVVAF